MILYELSKKKALGIAGGLLSAAGLAYGAKKAYDAGEEVYAGAKLGVNIDLGIKRLTGSVSNSEYKLLKNKLDNYDPGVFNKLKAGTEYLGTKIKDKLLGGNPTIDKDKIISKYSNKILHGLYSDGSLNRPNKE